MLSVIQLVTHVAVSVDDVVIGSIQNGIMALIGVEKMDTEKENVGWIFKNNFTRTLCLNGYTVR